MTHEADVKRLQDECRSDLWRKRRGWAVDGITVAFWGWILYRGLVELVR